MPSMAAVSILSRSSSVIVVRSFDSAPARMKAVPQIGPEQPPTFFEISMLILSSNPPIELWSSACHSCSTARKPEASETPKSASPAYESSSQKYCSFLSAVAAMVLTAVSTSAKVISFISLFPLDNCSCVLLPRPNRSRRALCSDGFQILQRDEDLRRVAELRHDFRGAFEVLVLRVGARRDQRRHAGAERGQQAIAAVLDDDAVFAFQLQALLREIVDLGIGLFLLDDVAGEHDLEPLLALRAEHVEHSVDCLRVRRRADAEPDARGVRFVDDTRDAGAQRQATLRDEVREDRGLALVQLGDQRLGRLAVRPTVPVEVVRHALLATRDLEQLAVELDVPFGVDAGRSERAVERDAMAVALGVDEHTVAVEDQGLHGGAV